MALCAHFDFSDEFMLIGVGQSLDLRLAEDVREVCSRYGRKIRTAQALSFTRRDSHSQYPPYLASLNSRSHASILSSVGLKKQMHLRCGNRSIDLDGGYAAVVLDDGPELLIAEAGNDLAGLSILSVRYTSCDNRVDCVEASDTIGVCSGHNHERLSETRNMEQTTVHES